MLAAFAVLIRKHVLMLIGPHHGSNGVAEPTEDHLLTTDRPNLFSLNDK